MHLTWCDVARSIRLSCHFTRLFSCTSLIQRTQQSILNVGVVSSTCLSMACCAQAPALYTPGGAARVPQSMRSPVAQTDGSKTFRTTHGLSGRSRGGRVVPKAPGQAAQNGGGAACGAQGGAQLAANTGRLEPSPRYVSQTPVDGSNIFFPVASPIVPIGSWGEYSDLSTGPECGSSLAPLVR